MDFHVKIGNAFAKAPIFFHGFAKAINALSKSKIGNAFFSRVKFLN